MIEALAALFPVFAGVMILYLSWSLDGAWRRIERLERHHPDIMRERTKRVPRKDVDDPDYDPAHGSLSGQ